MKSSLLSLHIAAVLLGSTASTTAVFAQSAPDRGGVMSSVYMIEFAEPGLLEMQRQQAPGQRFDARSASTIAHRDQLQQSHASFRDTMRSKLAREVVVTHHYLVTHSGMAAVMTEVEAEEVSKIPGVVAIKPQTFERMETQRGPSFIGADTIWSGTSVPGGIGHRGAGIVIGTLDSGSVLPHPSMSNDPSCGHGMSAPAKVLSSLDCASTDVAGLCNGPSPGDTDGHGSHTASTSGGNRLTQAATPAPEFPEISGVAPCASARIYKVCPDSCPSADIQAALNSVLLHGDVDVVNFSISGGTSPWTDNDRRKLDLVDGDVVVVASAGNTRAEIPNPVGQVNHRGPWVLSVAASTHDETGETIDLMSVSGPGTPPTNLVDVLMGRGSDSPNGANQTNLPIRHFTGQVATAEGCTAGEDNAPADLVPFPANFFTGAAALIQRGTCPFTKKVTNAFNAGASFVIIRNNQVGALSMSTVGQPQVPAYSISQVKGNALVAFVDSNPTTATVNMNLGGPMPGDVLADFSLRGPTPGVLVDLQKPNITGPGVNIYAATTDPSGYGFISGTSMSGPHLAGSAALVRAVQPTWEPVEVLSALQTTAVRAGQKDDFSGAWDWDDVGSGRVDLTAATRAGLLMNETFANFLAANPATGGDVKTLNTPSVRDVSCEPNCTFTRTVRAVLPGPVTYNVTVDQPTGFNVVVSPTSFTLGANATQALTITATPARGTEAGTLIRFGAINLTPTVSGPTQHITVAGRGNGIRVFAGGFE